MKFPFIGGAYTGRSLYANASTCKNFFIEPPSKGADEMLVPTPGYYSVKISTVGPTAPVRGILYPGTGDVVYYVVGNAFCSLKLGTLTTTLLSGASPMTSSAGPVSMEINSASGTSGQVIICDGFDVWQFDIALEIAVPGSGWFSTSGRNTNTVCFMDGRFIIDDQDDPGRFYYSDLYTSSFTAFNFATSEGSPDYLRAVLADRRELWLFGDNSTEIWFDAGDPNLPFQRSQGGFIQMGIAAPYTAKKFDNSVVWLSQNERGQGQVVRAGNAYQPEVISPPEINYQLWSSSLTGSYAMVYQVAGHEFYILTVPQLNKTFVFDALSKEWHTWRTGTNDYHTAQCICSVQNQILMGLTTSDRTIYALQDTLYGENGTAINRERTTTHAHNNRERIRIANLQIDVEAGPAANALRSTVIENGYAAVVGDTVLSITNALFMANDAAIAITMDSGRVHTASIVAFDPGVTPNTVTIDLALTEGAAAGNAVVAYPAEHLTLELSKDGGATWGTATTVHIGTPVTKRFRTFIRRLGHARNWTVRLKTNTTSKIAILGAYAKLWGEDRDEAG